MRLSWGTVFARLRIPSQQRSSVQVRLLTERLCPIMFVAQDKPRLAGTPGEPSRNLAEIPVG